MRALGLMSGTSMDGIDVAYVETDGQGIEFLGPFKSFAYDPAFRADLRAVMGMDGPVLGVEADLTARHIRAVRDFLAANDIAPGMIDVIGFHGQTILHRPEQGVTRQIGDGARMARELGIRVVNDFRSQDVRAGGQGAPLVPLFHQALMRGLSGPVACLNLGGVGNVTWIGQDGLVLAFDTGPANALLDDWVLSHTDQPFDRDGALSMSGSVWQDRVDRFAAHPWFAMHPPKSLDRDHFRAFVSSMVEDLSVADGAATLAAMTVRSVVLSLSHFPDPPRQWLVCGGGRLNRAIMRGLADHLTATVWPIDRMGWDGDAIEAQAFAFLAVRSVLGLPLSVPGTTGCPTPQTGGVLHHP